ncbi:MAG: 1-phosphofructokinase family hexose kinase [Planctomycetota bacterium]|nr:1-phosphofructokinase family hexose kinase [Planctomycetota bacterium]MDA1137829.1 1-phosphofructokinase family hexose kinase [Planctomycetota bacterium]
MILTVTLSPVLDKIYTCKEFSTSGVYLAHQSSLFAGGKGINVSRAIAGLGGVTLAIGFAGGATGLLLRKLLDKDGIPHDFTETESEIRLHPTIRSKSAGEDLHIIENAAVLSEKEISAFMIGLEHHLEQASILVIAGRPRQTMPEMFVNDLCSEAIKSGCRIVADLSGQALKEVVETNPWLIKPNPEELGELVNLCIESDEGAIAAGRNLVSDGVTNVLISLGAAGALLINKSGVWKASPPEVAAINTVGCGDSLLAGFLKAIESGHDWPTALRHGVAAGTVNVRHDCPGRVPQEEFAEILSRVEIGCL